MQAEVKAVTLVMTITVTTIYAGRALAEVRCGDFTVHARVEDNAQIAEGMAIAWGCLHRQPRGDA